MATKQTSRPRSAMPRARESVIDVLYVRDETMSGSEQCVVCEGGFEDEDEVMVRLRDFKAMVDYHIHRRCVLLALEHGPADDTEFNEYRQNLERRYS